MTASAEPARPRPVARRGRAAEGRPPSIAREVAKSLAASLAAVLVFVLASIPLLRHLGRSEAIREARAVAGLAAQGVVEPNLEDALLAGDPAALARMDRVVQERVLSDSIVRVKIWAQDGRIVYSDEPRLIGSRYALGEEDRAAFQSGAVNAELSDLQRPENRFERAEGELLEVYQRIRTPSGTPVLFELYERFDSVVASGRRIWTSFLPALLGALLLLWLVQVPLAYRLARRVREGHAERELLLRRALDASNDERRRIASELHDGVVQDLAGISYSLAAAAEGAPAASDPRLARTLRDGAAGTRASLRQLRSLLLAIHPPSVRVAGLEAAIADLVAPLEQEGVAVDLELDAASQLGPEVEDLVFRAAREALRNVADHAAGATRVTVRLTAAEGIARLEVDDDGAGFDAEERERRRQEGHVGLSLLEELAAHSGGRVDVRSARGRGTSFVLEVPTS